MESVLQGIAGLGINLPALLWQLVNFALLLAILYLLLYKPILRVLDQRSARIKESMDQVERIKEESARAEEQVRAQLDTARKEGQGVIAQASQIGERLRDEALQEARREAESLVARARGDIQRERDEALEELRHEFADLAIQAAEKVINQSLDKEAHRRLIQEVLEQSGNGEKE